MESNGMTIKKVSVLVLLELLEDLYDKGVDYVDVHGKPISDDQDILGVSFSKGYMNPDCVENFDTFEDSEDSTDEEEVKASKEVKKISLKDEDLDRLA